VSSVSAEMQLIMMAAKLARPAMKHAAAGMESAAREMMRAIASRVRL